MGVPLFYLHPAARAIRAMPPSFHSLTVHFSDSTSCVLAFPAAFTMASTALPLLRSLLREARHINDYNFRSYAVRRVKAGFNKNRTLSG